MERKIDELEGSPNGTLFIALGQMHGNEPAGTKALKKVFEMLRLNIEEDKGFGIAGKIVGLVGNIPAADAGFRFLDEDLNRMWTSERILPIKTPHYATDDLNREERELLALEEAIVEEIRSYPAKDLFIFDIHTTTANGGSFSIPIPKPEAQRVANTLQVPVIHGLSGSLQGTLIQYAAHNPWKVETASLAFEAGQHESPQAISVAISAIIQAMMALDILNKHPLSGKKRLEGQPSLPLNSKIVYRHRIKEGDEFVMKPGYRNFMPIKRGEELARDKNGPIHSPYTGLILMPLYQAQGEDGFFIVVEESA
ncbi:MAG: succinylglutamate desuccinylase/aspartoacylase family protein [Bacteroidia bacterium]|nr:succinylglutamate desuccinylase/aspartoacylase family protein [Bacteroidia bacterium]